MKTHFGTVVALCLVVGIAGACAAPGGGSDAGSGSASGPGTASGSSGSGGTSGSQGDTIQGTFSAPSISAMISGAMVGTYANPYTQWNGEGSFDLAATGGLPTALTVTSMLPSGETAGMTINLSRINAMPAGGTFDCTGAADDDVTIAFQVFPAGSTTATNQYVAESGCGNGCSCTFTFQPPTLVNESSNEGSFQVYSVHGSLTAVMPNQPPNGGNPDGTMGMLNLTF